MKALVGPEISSVPDFVDDNALFPIVFLNVLIYTYLFFSTITKNTQYNLIRTPFVNTQNVRIIHTGFGKIKDHIWRHFSTDTTESKLF